MTKIGIYFNIKVVFRVYLKSIYLKDLWPSNEEIETLVNTVVTKDQFKKTYSTSFDGDDLN